MNDVNIGDIVATCTAVLHRYATCLDHGPAASSAECFAETAVWRTPDIELNGRASIGSFFANRSETIRTRHLFTNLSFDLGNVAAPTSTSYVLVYRFDLDRPDQPPEHFVVDVANEWVNERGQWLINLHDCAPANMVHGHTSSAS